MVFDTSTFLGTRILISTLLTLSIATPAVWGQADGPKQTKPAPPVAGTKAESLVAERERLDQTVYRQERLAQEYEQPIVKFWDRLRADDPFAVLADLKFDKFVPPVPESGRRQLDWGVPGIVTQNFRAGQTGITHTKFRERLSQLQRDGWKIRQTEWHHQEFEPAVGDRRAQSVVSFALNVNRGNRRMAFNGKLRVTWTEGLSGDGLHIPGLIEVVELNTIERTGTALFANPLTIDPLKSTEGQRRLAQPLLLSDLDGDGLSEVLLLGANLLYKNLGGGRLESRPLCARPQAIDGAGIVADFDGDGTLDLIAAPRARGRLHLFRGKEGAFDPQGVICFDRELESPQGITAGDVDSDGDLDLFVFQYKAPYVGGQMPTPYYDANDGYPSYLLRNDGQGGFTDTTEASGMAARRHRRTYSAALVDLDDDGKLDLTVVSDFAGIDLYRGDGRGRFTETTQDWVGQRHAFGMGHTFDDFSGDGRLDLYMIGMSSTTARRIVGMGIKRPGFAAENEKRSVMGYGNRMYLAKGPRAKPRFAEPDFNDRVARTGWSWGVTSADFDNDGDRDLYVANGHVSGKSCQDYCTRFWSHDIYANQTRPDRAFENLFTTELQSMIRRETSWNGYEKNVLYLNRDGKDFLNAAHLMGVAYEFDSRAIVSDDIDGDGRIDLLVVERDQQQLSQKLRIAQNVGDKSRHWIGVRLRPTAGGPSPLGARVQLILNDPKQPRRIAHILAGDSYMAQHATVAHFGLGSVDSVQRVEIRWPNGKVTTIESPALKRYHTVPAPGAGSD